MSAKDERILDLVFRAENAEAAIVYLRARLARYEELEKAARAWRHVPDFDPRCVFCGTEEWPHQPFNGTSCPIGDLCSALDDLAALDTEEKR